MTTRLIRILKTATAMGLITLVAVSFLTGCGFLPREDDPQAPALPEPPKLTKSITYPVERMDIFEQVEGSSIVTPIRQTELYFKQSGRLTELYVQPQDEVVSGQVMAKLETSDLEYQLRIGEIDLEIARTYYQMAQLEGSGATQLKIQKLQLTKEEMRIQRLRDLLEAAIVRAPYDGIVNRVRIEPGDYVEEYDMVIEVSDPTDLELQMKVSLDDYDKTSAGQKAFVEVKRDDWRPATVIQTTYLNPRNNASIRREEYVVHLELDEKLSEPLSPNTRLSTRIVLKERIGTLAIPLAALREFKERTYVRVLEDDVRREVDVKVGIRTETKGEILEGLNEGDLVIGK